jgi:peroxiredoxin
MALTHTPPLHDMTCPDFSVRATDGKIYHKTDFCNPKGFLVMFICNHCPYVKAIEDRLIALGEFLKERNFPVVAVCSNDAQSYPEDSFENLKKRSEEKNYPFPYLFDENQSMAKSFDAVCTPDFFVFDGNQRLAYRGQLDNSWKESSQVTHEALKEAILCLLEGKALVGKQISSMGCSIKWIK